MENQVEAYHILHTPRPELTSGYIIYYPERRLYLSLHYFREKGVELCAVLTGCLDSRVEVELASVPSRVERILWRIFDVVLAFYPFQPLVITRCFRLLIGS